MTMPRLTPHLREVLADKLLDAGNIAAGAMLFGQFVADRPFSPGLATLGTAIWLFLVVCAIVIWEESDQWKKSE